MEQLKCRYLQLTKDAIIIPEMEKVLDEPLEEFMELTAEYEANSDRRFPQLQLLAFHTYFTLWIIDKESKTSRIASELIRTIFCTRGAVSNYWK
jgi:hypothetical protein